eukprot:4404037-Karenia_brevis.AAC.1
MAEPSSHAAMHAGSPRMPGSESELYLSFSMEEITHGVAIVNEEAIMTIRCSDGDDAMHGKKLPTDPSHEKKRRK